LDTSGFLEWLKGSLSSPENAVGRKILRFVRPDDDKKFFRMLQAERSKHKNLRGIRRLGIIRAYSCPIPPDGLPASFGGVIDWEDDIRIATHSALPRPAAQRASFRGIPWGVRRIRAPEAWSRTTGHRVKVGVIDTGVDFDHPDLRHSLERGINLLYRTMLPYDDNGHGTHIAGTIAAANRMQGMIGVAPRSVIYPIKAFDYNGTAYVSDIILGIDWSVRNRMDVVNMSFGMRTRSKSLLDAVAGAYRSGVLIVASSGNDGKQGRIDYPARSRYTVAVGATNRKGEIASFTNRSDAVDIYAPGEKVDSCWLRGNHKTMSGTSMATSHVTGAIALLLAHKPGLAPDRVKAVLKRSMRPLKNARAPRKAGELDIMRMLQASDKMT